MHIGFDRRQFLAGSAGVLSTVLLPKSLRAVIAEITAENLELKKKI